MRIKRFSGETSLSETLRGGVVAIGNFDGVHRGHQSVLDRALEISQDANVPSLVMTFEPHPRAIFQPENAPYRLSPASLKARVLEVLGFDAVIEQNFTRDFAGKSADDFIQHVLIEQLGASHIVTGFDFHFGKGREGGPAFLMEAGKINDFGVTLVDAFRDEGSQVISSSRIRSFLKDGELGEANSLLGYHFTVSGVVVKGKQLGRTLGYPTANISLSDDGGLKTGIYAVRFRLDNGKLYDGVASFGIRPTVEDNGEPVLETYIFDFDGDIYGQTCQVSLVSYLREEAKFDGLDALVAQMKDDEAEARQVLSTISPISPLDQAMCFNG
jgi:riboflavin kinase/FMN adenylyltransferase